jgi:hypothetical protein
MCVDIIVGKICVGHCVPYNLFIFNMKLINYTAEFKKKEEEEMLILPVQQHYRVDETNIRRWKKHRSNFTCHRG